MKLILLIFILITSIEAKLLFTNEQQEENSVYIGALKDLLIASQKTRGLTNSYLNGNEADILLVYNNRNDMKKAIGVMESLSMSADPVLNARATKISQELIKLNAKAFKTKDPKEVFASYTEQIDNILMLAQAVNKREAKKMSNYAQQSSHIMMETMLPMTEYIGQLRGFASGLAAKGYVTKDDENHIHALMGEIQRLSNELKNEALELMNKFPTQKPKEFIAELEKINKIAMSYIDFSEKKFLIGEIDVDPSNYFENGTKVISFIMQGYNSLNSSVMKDAQGWF